MVEHLVAELAVAASEAAMAAVVMVVAARVAVVKE